MEKLKPCPFCGGNAEMVKHRRSFHNDGDKYYKIWCSVCNASIDTYLSEKEAVNEWNRRADDDDEKKVR